MGFFQVIMTFRFNQYFHAEILLSLFFLVRWRFGNEIKWDKAKQIQRQVNMETI